MPRILDSIERQRQAAGVIRLPEATRFSVALAMTLLLAKGEPVEATPESGAGALFLLISPSVRVNGMGQAGVALPDEPAGYYNPGAAALSSPAHTVRSRLYLSEMPWLPELAGDMTYGYHAVQAAGGRVLPALSWRGPTRLDAALYGYRTKMDLGQDLPAPDRGCPGHEPCRRRQERGSRSRSSKRSLSAEASTTTSMVRSTSRPREGLSGPTASSGTWRTTWRAHRPAPRGMRSCSSPGTCRSAGPGSSTTRHGPPAATPTLGFPSDSSGAWSSPIYVERQSG